MAGPRHALADLSEQQVDQITLAKALAGAADRRQCLLGGDGAVPGRDRLEAGIAVAAGRGEGFPEVLQEDLAATPCRLAIAEQRAQLVLLDAPSLIALARGDEPPELGDVAHAPGHYRGRRQAIAAGAPGLLIVRLQALRRVEVVDETHVGLVDAH